VIELDVMVEDDRWSRLGDLDGMARRAVAAALAVAPGAPTWPVEVSLLLTGDAAVQALNREWRGQDKPTNVLSFPASGQPGLPGPRHLGDIALAYETLAREADQERKPLLDHATHLIVHGMLHLLGFDHELEAEAQIMEGLEIQALATLGVGDPYADRAA
jgi:probable rRNA maturation factor